ncbi:MAG: hypothetical protein WBA16_10520 [Nonlabens sp.]
MKNLLIPILLSSIGMGCSAQQPMLREYLEIYENRLRPTTCFENEIKHRKAIDSSLYQVLLRDLKKNDREALPIVTDDWEQLHDQFENLNISDILNVKEPLVTKKPPSLSKCLTIEGVRKCGNYLLVQIDYLYFVSLNLYKRDTRNKKLTKVLIRDNWIGSRE